MGSDADDKEQFDLLNRMALETNTEGDAEALGVNNEIGTMDEISWPDDILDDKSAPFDVGEPISNQPDNSLDDEFDWLHCDLFADEDENLSETAFGSDRMHNTNWLTGSAGCIRLYADDDAAFELKPEFEPSNDAARTIFLGGMNPDYSIDDIHSILSEAYGEISCINIQMDEIHAYAEPSNDASIEDIEVADDVGIEKSLKAPSSEFKDIFTRMESRSNIVRSSAKIRLKSILNKCRRNSILNETVKGIKVEISDEQEEVKHAISEVEKALKLLDIRIAAFEKLTSEIDSKWQKLSHSVSELLGISIQWPDDLNESKILEDLGDIPSEHQKVIKRKVALFCKYSCQFDSRLNLILEQFSSLDAKLYALSDVVENVYSPSKDEWTFLTKIDVNEPVSYRSFEKLTHAGLAKGDILATKAKTDKFIDNKSVSPSAPSISALVSFTSLSSVEHMMSPSVQVFGIALPNDPSRNSETESDLYYYKLHSKIVPELATNKTSLIISGFPVDWSVKKVKSKVTELLGPICNKIDLSIHETSEKICESGICVIDFESHRKCLAAVERLYEEEMDGFCAGFHSWGRSGKLKRRRRKH